jgi:hypothetical protein
VGLSWWAYRQNNWQGSHKTKDAPVIMGITALTGAAFTYETWIADYFWTFPRFLDLSLKVLQLRPMGFAGHRVATGLHIPFRADHSIYMFARTYTRNFRGADAAAVRKIYHGGCADVVTMRYDLQGSDHRGLPYCPVLQPEEQASSTENDNRMLYSMLRARPIIIQPPTSIDRDRQNSQDRR